MNGSASFRCIRAVGSCSCSDTALKRELFVYTSSYEDIERVYRDDEGIVLMHIMCNNIKNLNCKELDVDLWWCVCLSSFLVDRTMCQLEGKTHHQNPFRNLQRRIITEMLSWAQFSLFLSFSSRAIQWDSLAFKHEKRLRWLILGRLCWIQDEHFASSGGRNLAIQKKKRDLASSLF